MHPTKRNVIAGFLLFFAGNMFPSLMDKLRYLPSPLVQDKSRLRAPRDDQAPRVYIYQDGSLSHVPDFCKWTPQYECAELNTPSGPVSVQIHSVRKGDPSPVSQGILKSNTWEPWVMNVLLEELKNYPDAGFIDVGCNIGPFSLLAAKMGRKVLTVDAIIDNMLRVCKSVVTNNFTDRVVMVANPVSNEHTVVSLNSPTRTYEYTKVEKYIAPKQKSVCPSVKSQTVMLDDMRPLINFKSAIMKVDVESFEFFIVSGGLKLFSEIHIPAVIMEWEHVKKTDKAEQLVEIMKKFNYIPHSVVKGGKSQLLKFTEFETWTHDVLWKTSDHVKL